MQVRRALCDGRLSMYYVDIGAHGAREAEK